MCSSAEAFAEREKTITIFTAFMHNRSGDLFAALRFMREVVNNNQDTSFNWVVKRDIECYLKGENYLQRLLEQQNLMSIVKLELIDSKDYSNVIIENEKVYQKIHDGAQQIIGSELSDNDLEIMSDNNWGLRANRRNEEQGWVELREACEENKLLKNKIIESDIICCVPNFHRMSYYDRKYLGETFRKPFLAVSEYGVNTAKGLEEASGGNITGYYQTGLGGNDCGIYVPDEIVNASSLSDISEEDKILKDLLCENYSSNKEKFALYYCYLNNSSVQEKNEDWGNVSSLENYIFTAITLAAAEGKTRVDIVVPSSIKKLEKNDFIEIIDNDNPVSIQVLNIKSNCVEYDGEEEATENNICVRIINPGTVSNKTVQCLLKSSELLAGLTGDQSFVEGILSGKLAFYQVMRWKKNFFLDFVTCCSDKFGKDSSIYRFYEAQYIHFYNKEKPTKEDKKAALSNIIEIYKNNKEELQNQAVELSEHIKLNKNLTKNMIPFFYKAVQEIIIVSRDPLLHALNIGNKNEAKMLLKKMQENITLEKDSNKKKIVMLTAAAWGTQGDVNAAAKFMQESLNQKENIEFTWVVRKDVESSNIELAKICPKRVKLIKIESENHYDKWRQGWPELRKNYDLINLLISADMICSFPTTHYFSDKDLWFFDCLGKKFISISEYDYDDKFKHNKRILFPDGMLAEHVDTGFSRDSQGVLAFESKAVGFEDVAKGKDKVVFDFLQAIEGDGKPDINNTLFFGYLNSNMKMVSSKCRVNLESFIEVCLKKALSENNHKNIDFCLPVKSELEFNLIINNILDKLEDKEKSNIKSISFFKRNNNKDTGTDEFLQVSVKEVSEGEHNCKEVRVFNPFNLEYNTMQLLMQFSDEIVGLTGDQSFIEGLVMGKLVCYQAMQWKEKQITAFIQLCSDVCGHDSAVYKFYQAQNQKDSEIDRQNLDEMLEIYFESKNILLEQSKEIARYILDNKNFCKIYIPKFIDKLKLTSESQYSESNSLYDGTFFIPEFKGPVDKGYGKTLRADEVCFIRDFWSSMGYSGLESHVEVKKYPLRHKTTARFTARSKGEIADRLRKLVLLKENREGEAVKLGHKMYLNEEKEGFSKNQSVTFFDTKTGTPYFGFSNRGEKTVGVIGLKTLLRSYHQGDGGTVGRPDDFDDETKALSFSQKYAVSMLKKDESKHVAECSAVKFSGNKTYNEFLARCQWDFANSSICDFSGTEESLYIAIDYARLLKQHLLQNPKLTPKVRVAIELYEVPITRYIPSTQEHVLIQRENIEQVKKKALEKIDLETTNYEFLLVIDDIEKIKKVLQDEEKMKLLFTKYLHIAETLIEKFIQSYPNEKLRFSDEFLDSVKRMEFSVLTRTMIQKILFEKVMWPKNYENKYIIPGNRITRVNLNDMDLTSFDLRNKTIENTTFKNSNISSLRGCTLSGVNMQKVNIKDQECFSEITFEKGKYLCKISKNIFVKLLELEQVPDIFIENEDLRDIDLNIKKVSSSCILRGCVFSEKHLLNVIGSFPENMDGYNSALLLVKESCLSEGLVYEPEGRFVIISEYLYEKVFHSKDILNMSDSELELFIRNYNYYMSDEIKGKLVKLLSYDIGKDDMKKYLYISIKNKNACIVRELLNNDSYKNMLPRMVGYNINISCDDIAFVMGIYNNPDFIREYIKVSAIRLKCYSGFCVNFADVLSVEQFYMFFECAYLNKGINFLNDEKSNVLFYEFIRGYYVKPKISLNRVLCKILTERSIYSSPDEFFLIVFTQLSFVLSNNAELADSSIQLQNVILDCDTLSDRIFNIIPRFVNETKPGDIEAGHIKVINSYFLKDKKIDGDTLLILCKKVVEGNFIMPLIELNGLLCSVINNNNYDYFSNELLLSIFNLLSNESSDNKELADSSVQLQDVILGCDTLLDKMFSIIPIFVNETEPEKIEGSHIKVINSLLLKNKKIDSDILLTLCKKVVEGNRNDSLIALNSLLCSMIENSASKYFSNELLLAVFNQLTYVLYDNKDLSASSVQLQNVILGCDTLSDKMFSIIPRYVNEAEPNKIKGSHIKVINSCFLKDKKIDGGILLFLCEKVVKANFVDSLIELNVLLCSVINNSDSEYFSDELLLSIFNLLSNESSNNKELADSSIQLQNLILGCDTLSDKIFSIIPMFVNETEPEKIYGSHIKVINLCFLKDKKIDGDTLLILCKKVVEDNFIMSLIELNGLLCSVINNDNYDYFSDELLLSIFNLLSNESSDNKELADSSVQLQKAMLGNAVLADKIFNIIPRFVSKTAAEDINSVILRNIFEMNGECNRLDENVLNNLICKVLEKGLPLRLILLKKYLLEKVNDEKFKDSIQEITKKIPDSIELLSKDEEVTTDDLCDIFKDVLREGYDYLEVTTALKRISNENIKNELLLELEKIQQEREVLAQDNNDQCQTYRRNSPRFVK